jgi:thioglycine synthase
MDRLLVPNYSVVLPGTEDRIWVYSGKGVERSEAKASALMETLERYSALSSTYHGSIIQGSYLQLSKIYGKVLHPDEVVEPTSQEYNDSDRAILDFIPGFDLLDNEMVLVPAEIGLYCYHPKYPSIRAFSNSHTNGLASGNTLEEAIAHALCEVIERDAVSIAGLCASSIPYNILKKIRESLKKDGYPAIKTPYEERFVDDSSIFLNVNISDIDFGPIKKLVRSFSNANIPLFAKEITQKDVGIPTFVASSVEWITHDYGYFAKGYGTHPDARIALIRAITEASQTRAANIQGARDDLKRIRYSENDEIYKRKWQFMTSNSKTIEFSQIKTYSNEEILEDINLILSKLKKAGLKRAIIIDLTNTDVGIPVVRAVVPGLETFEVTGSVMGRRARESFSAQCHCHAPD